MKSKLVLDCERMRYPHTGIYHFCAQLGHALLEVVNAETEELFFYMRLTAEPAFGNQAHYLRQQSLDKFYMPSIACKVWHATFQGSNYFPFRKKAPIVFTVHDLNFLHEDMETARQKKMLRQLQCKIDRANYVVAISNYVLNDLKQHTNLGNTPTAVVYNGCNVDNHSPISPPAIIRERPFLFTIGTIGPKKNFHVLPALLVNNNMDLVIAGITENQAYKDLILAEAEKLGVAERVIFTRSISENDKKAYLSSCTAFVFPSLAEGFGLPVIEAMYFGKPVILSRLTSLPEIGGDYAYYFDNFEPAAMRTVLTNALAHYEANAPAEAIEAHAKTFSWQNTAQQYLSIYRSLY